MNTRAVAAGYRLSQWTQIMQERISAGLIITEFCQNRGISKNTYFYRQRKIRKSACEQLATQQSRFAEVYIRQEQNKAASQICIAMGGVEIKLDASHPTEKLAVLVRELIRS